MSAIPKNGDVAQKQVLAAAVEGHSTENKIRQTLTAFGGEHQNHRGDLDDKHANRQTVPQCVQHSGRQIKGRVMAGA